MKTWKADCGLVVTLDDEGYAVCVHDGRDRPTLAPGDPIRGQAWDTPAKTAKNLAKDSWTLIIEEVDPDSRLGKSILAASDYRIAIRDANAQAVLKTALMEFHLLLQEYDMQDTVFGLKFKELSESYYEDMSGRMS